MKPSLISPVATRLGDFWFSWMTSFGALAMQVGGEELDELVKLGVLRKSEQHARHYGAKRLEGIGQIDGVRGSLCDGQQLAGVEGGQGAQIGGEDFGVEILFDRQGSFAREVLDQDSRLEQFERFLDAPTGMVERGEFGDGIGGLIEQRSDQNFDLAGGQDHAYQAQPQRGKRHAAGGELGAMNVARLHCHHGIGLAGAKKGLDRRPRGFDAHAKVALPLLQQGEQPIGRIAAVEYEQIIGGEMSQQLHQLIALGDLARPDHGSQHQATGHGEQAAGARQTVRVARLGRMQPIRFAGAGARQGQPQSGGVTRHDPQPVPTAMSEDPGDGGQQGFVEIGKTRDGQFLASHAYRVGADATTERRGIGQSAKEAIYLDRQSFAQAAQQQGDQAGETQGGITGEILRLLALAVDEVGATQEGFDA